MMIAALTACAAMLSTATAHPIPRTDAPLDRVIPNLEARVQENPEDAAARYSLGRAHALAYAGKRDMIRVLGRSDENIEPLPPDARDWRSPREGDPQGKPLTQEELAVHLREAVRRLTEAIRMEREPRYYLALASVLESAGEACLDLDPTTIVPPNPYGRGVHIPVNPNAPPGDPYVHMLPEARAREVVRARILGGTFDPGAYTGAADEETVETLHARRNAPDEKVRAFAREVFKDFWFEHTRDAYFLAFALAMATEAKADTRPMGSGGLRISVEAGSGFLRVCQTRPDRAGDGARVAIVSAAVKELSKQQEGGGITPIIFSLDGPHSLDDLLLPDARVSFRLDGTDRPQRWSWVKPDTGILVWDPKGLGFITSGRQLFGSVTWWLMFRDGYEALEALDDNRDGQLTGSELAGLAVWCDRNSDGASDAEEVAPVGSVGIVAISTHTTGRVGSSPLNREGLWLTDGRVLPTYDWVAKRARLPDTTRVSR